MTALHWLFPVAAVGAAAILTALAEPVPRRAGALALVLTLAALGVAILH
ncbi:hypothetical protein [Streptomyces drozdowiczii]|uniref:NADH-quinone oxidoreductase subunit M n=1 Tax=Streptomyces drozdowiczii TaxID=202862 RepID=A0ABY6PPD6_9ACTN|nr:hypothetical protein [Streptomyces drozdowiczii]MCX0246430.1 hypothetical protein [Streptomyces drozdowiczii]UZK54067.1 hypothetical protein NEH16_07805 [Streptomyces drozdowiczii]